VSCSVGGARHQWQSRPRRALRQSEHEELGTAPCRRGRAAKGPGSAPWRHEAAAPLQAGTRYQQVVSAPGSASAKPVLSAGSVAMSVPVLMSRDHSTRYVSSAIVASLQPSTTRSREGAVARTRSPWRSTRSRTASRGGPTPRLSRGRSRSKRARPARTARFLPRSPVGPGQAWNNPSAVAGDAALIPVEWPTAAAIARAATSCAFHMGGYQVLSFRLLGPAPGRKSCFRREQASPVGGRGSVTAVALRGAPADWDHKTMKTREKSVTQVRVGVAARLRRHVSATCTV